MVTRTKRWTALSAFAFNKQRSRAAGTCDRYKGASVLHRSIDPIGCDLRFDTCLACFERAAGPRMADLERADWHFPIGEGDGQHSGSLRVVPDYNGCSLSIQP